MSTPPSRPRPRPTPAPKKSGGVASVVMKTAWLVAVAAGVWFVLNMQKTSQGPPTANAQAPPGASAVPPPHAPSPSPAATVAPENLQNVELTTAASIQRQQLTTAKFRQRQVIATYDEVTRALKAWETELYAWEKTGPPLVKNEDGKPLARDQTLVKRYRVVMNQELPTREELTSTSGLADDLVSPVREAFANPEDASIPSNDTTTNLRELRTRARKARDDLKNAREQIEVLLAEAGETPGDETLQAAIRRQVEQEASGRNALIAEAVRKAEEEGNRRVAEEKANAARVALEQEAAKLKQEQEAARQRHLAAMRKAQLDAEAEANDREEQEIGTSPWVASLFPYGLDLGGDKLSRDDFRNAALHVYPPPTVYDGRPNAYESRERALQQKYGKERTLYDAYLFRRKYSLKLDDREQ